jgi:hypothetical protein
VEGWCSRLQPMHARHGRCEVGAAPARRPAPSGGPAWSDPCCSSAVCQVCERHDVLLAGSLGRGCSSCRSARRYRQVVLASSCGLGLAMATVAPPSVTALARIANRCSNCGAHGRSISGETVRNLGDCTVLHPMNSDEVVFTVSGAAAKSAHPIGLADAGLKEREHLQAWVIAHPEILGPGVMIVSFEFDRWASVGGPQKDRLDVLGLGADGRLVVAELKRGAAPDTVDMQALKYAAMASRLPRSCSRSITSSSSRSR